MNALDMRQRSALRGLDVIEQRACCRQCECQVGHAESIEVAAVELLRQPGVRAIGVELPRGEAAYCAGCAAQGEIVGCEDFGRAHARQQSGQGVGWISLT